MHNRTKHDIICIKFNVLFDIFFEIIKVCIKINKEQRTDSRGTPAFIDVFRRKTIKDNPLQSNIEMKDSKISQFKNRLRPSLSMALNISKNTTLNSIDFLSSKHSYMSFVKKRS